MFNFIGRAFSEDNGNPSSTRMLTAFVVVSIISVWGYVSIIKGEIAPLPTEAVVAIVGALGAKVWQKGKEANGTPQG